MLFFFFAVVLLCLTDLWSVMEYKKALEIPFKVDKDHVVSMKLFLFSVFNVLTSHLSNKLKSLLLSSLCIKSGFSLFYHLCKEII